MFGSGDYDSGVDSLQARSKEPANGGTQKFFPFIKLNSRMLFFPFGFRRGGGGGKSKKKKKNRGGFPEGGGAPPPLEKTTQVGAAQKQIRHG